MKGDSIILVMFSALLGVLIAFGIAYLIERIREAQGESAEEYEENFMPARKRRSERLSELRYAAAGLRIRKTGRSCRWERIGTRCRNLRSQSKR